MNHGGTEFTEIDPRIFFSVISVPPWFK